MGSKKSVLMRFISILIVALLFTISIPFTSYATQSRTANFNRNYSLTGNKAIDIANVAKAQIGRTTAQLGYTEYWCADFVSDCAILAKATAAIPQHGGSTSLYKLVTGAGGYQVSSAQAGDLVFYPESSNSFFHVGIMIDSINSVQGNITDRDSGITAVYKLARPSLVSSNYIFIRPNYAGAGPKIDTLVEESVSIEDAKIKGRVHANGSTISRVGVTLWENGIEIWNFDEKSGLNHDFDIWYNLKNDFRVLKENTKYSYRFWCDANGTRYYSEIKDFYTLKDNVVPSISSANYANVTSSGFDVVCTATDNRTVKNVKFKTWTNRNGEDDAVWQEGVSSNGKWTCHVNVSAHNNEHGNYTVQVYAYDYSDNCGTYSIPVYVKDSLPVITNQPHDVTANVGEVVSFEVLANNASGYEWYLSDNNGGRWYRIASGPYEGTNSRKLTVTLDNNNISDIYRCEIRNSTGEYVYSNAVKVNEKLKILDQPVDVTAKLGQDVLLEVKAVGTSRYQWFCCDNGTWYELNENDIFSGVTSNKLCVHVNDLEVTSSSYKCVIYSANGDSISSDICHISCDVLITKQPQNACAAIGEKVFFSVEAEQANSYEWLYQSEEGKWVSLDSNHYNGCKTSTLSFIVDEYNSQLSYACSVKNYTSSIMSSSANVEILTFEITEQPKDVEASVGENVEFKVDASGANGYQWYYSTDGNKWIKSGQTGATTNKLTIKATSEKYKYSYRCEITDKSGRKLTSDTVRIIPKFAIIKQPTDMIARLGETVSFSVSAIGAKGYQWYYSTDGVKWIKSGQQGATTNQLAIKATSEKYNYSYRCEINDSAGNKLTSTSVKVIPKFEITKQPSTVTANVGEKVKFTVAATGASSFQWYYSMDGTKWIKSGQQGATTNQLVVTVSVSRYNYAYRCEIKNDIGDKLISDSACIVSKDYTFLITEQPTDMVAGIGETVTFKVVATGANSYQWYYSSNGKTWYKSTMAGATSNQLAVTASASKYDYRYRCVVMDDTGNKLTSNEVRLLQKASLLEITEQPTDVVAGVGEKVIFKVVATGASSYQWYYSSNGKNWYKSTMAGATTDQLSVTVSASKYDYRYRCVVMDDTGNKLTSDSACLINKNTLFGITEQPTDILANIGETVTFVLAANGADSYQWYYSKDGNNWFKSGQQGSTTDHLTIKVTAEKYNYLYRCIVTGESGNTITSDVVEILNKASTMIQVNKHENSAEGLENALFDMTDIEMDESIEDENDNAESEDVLESNVDDVIDFTDEAENDNENQELVSEEVVDESEVDTSDQLEITADCSENEVTGFSDIVE